MSIRLLLVMITSFPQYVRQGIDILFQGVVSVILVTGIFHATVSDVKKSTSLVVKWEFLSTSETVTISYYNTNNTQCFNDSNDI